MMALPIYTKSGQKWRREWIKIQLDEIYDYDKHNPPGADWYPMMRELYEWCCLLEDRLILLEEEQS